MFAVARVPLAIPRRRRSRNRFVRRFMTSCTTRRLFVIIDIFVDHRHSYTRLTYALALLSGSKCTAIAGLALAHTFSITSRLCAVLFWMVDDMAAQPHTQTNLLRVGSLLLSPYIMHIA